MEAEEVEEREEEEDEKEDEKEADEPQLKRNAQTTNQSSSSCCSPSSTSSRQRPSSPSGGPEPGALVAAKRQKQQTRRRPAAAAAAATPTAPTKPPQADNSKQVERIGDNQIDEQEMEESPDLFTAKLPAPPSGQPGERQEAAHSGETNKQQDQEFNQAIDGPQSAPREVSRLGQPAGHNHWAPSDAPNDDDDDQQDDNNNKNDDDDDDAGQPDEQQVRLETSMSHTTSQDGEPKGAKQADVLVDEASKSCGVAAKR